MSRSTKDNICLLVGLMKAWQVRHVVLCPGSRNAPIVHTLADDGYFVCHPVTDERSAGFVALGMIDALGERVAVCCTSGSAVLNIAPAVAEAFYRHQPLMVISADRPKEWIGQMDGQTLTQPHCFGEHALSYDVADYNIDDSHGVQTHWAAWRDINEALARMCMDGGQPVHVNIQLNEPLFSFTDEPLPLCQRIEWESEWTRTMQNEFAQSQRPMFIIGQHNGDASALASLLNDSIGNRSIVVLTENLSNCHVDSAFCSFDDILAKATEDDLQRLAPDFVVYIGGHIVSKRLKLWLRKVHPCVWHVTEGCHVIDLFMSVKRMVRMSEVSFAHGLSSLDFDNNNSLREDYYAEWANMENAVVESNNPELKWNSEGVVCQVIRMVSDYAADSQWSVALANSSTVRFAQKVATSPRVIIQCNRGVNGIEGSLSASVGYALACPDEKVLCIIGDLSFFYDMNALWNVNLPDNLRVLVVNNGGGAIFGTLRGLENSRWQWPYVAAQHNTSVSGWAHSAGCRYVEARNLDDLSELFADSECCIVCEAIV